MGQNGKVRKSRHKNKLKTVESPDLFEIQFAAPLEKLEPKSSIFPNYDFKAEVAKDADNEKRLLWTEIVVLCGIVLFVFIRLYLLSKF